MVEFQRLINSQLCMFFSIFPKFYLNILSFVGYFMIIYTLILKNNIIYPFYNTTISQTHGDLTDGNRHGLEEALESQHI